MIIRSEPMICKFERKGKTTTIIEGYEGSDEDFKILAKEIKTN
jgi:translation initiation factor 1